MKVKELLNQIKWIDDDIRLLMAERQTILAGLLRVSRMTPDKVQTSSMNSEEDKYIRIVEYAIRIADKSDEQLQLKIKLSNSIDAMENENHRRVLRLRYIFGYSWERIAEIMGYDIRHIYRIHGSALQEFESVVNSFDE